MIINKQVIRYLKLHSFNLPSPGLNEVFTYLATLYYGLYNSPSYSRILIGSLL